MKNIKNVIIGIDEAAGAAAAPIDGRTLIYDDGSKETFVPKSIMQWRFISALQQELDQEIKKALP